MAGNVPTSAEALLPGLGAERLSHWCRELKQQMVDAVPAPPPGEGPQLVIVAGARGVDVTAAFQRAEQRWPDQASPMVRLSPRVLIDAHQQQIDRLAYSGREGYFGYGGQYEHARHSERVDQTLDQKAIDRVKLGQKSDVEHARQTLVADAARAGKSLLVEASAGLKDAEMLRNNYLSLYTEMRSENPSQLAGAANHSGRAASNSALTEPAVINSATTHQAALGSGLAVPGLGAFQLHAPTIDVHLYLVAPRQDQELPVQGSQQIAHLQAYARALAAHRQQKSTALPPKFTPFQEEPVEQVAKRDLASWIKAFPEAKTLVIDRK